MTIWIAGYNSCIHESCAEVLSLHRSKKAAQAAVARHRKRTLREYRKQCQHMNHAFRPDWDSMMAWPVWRKKLKP